MACEGGLRFLTYFSHFLEMTYNLLAGSLSNVGQLFLLWIQFYVVSFLQSIYLDTVIFPIAHRLKNALVGLYLTSQTQSNVIIGSCPDPYSYVFWMDNSVNIF